MPRYHIIIFRFSSVDSQILMTFKFQIEVISIDVIIVINIISYYNAVLYDVNNNCFFYDVTEKRTCVLFFVCCFLSVVVFLETAKQIDDDDREMFFTNDDFF